MSDNSVDKTHMSLERRELLELLLAEMEEDTAQLSILPRRHDVDSLPLSFAQQRLWFLDQLEPGNTAYIAPMALRIEGALDVAALEQSLNLLVRRHESLRTRFEERANQPVQVIESGDNFGIHYVDIHALERQFREAEVARLVRQEAAAPFDLRQGGLLRATLLLLEEHSFVLFLTMHHIISDGWSSGVLVREVSAFYQAFSRGESPNPPPLPVQYADYALWQREHLQDAVLHEQVAYWKKQLADVIPLQLPTDYQRPAMQSFQGDRVAVSVPEPICRQLQQFSQREGVTLFMTLLTAFQILLLRYSGQEDIAIGTPIANRTRPELEGLIGFFVNTLVLRTDLSGRPSFREALQRVREVCLGAYEHQDVPFEQVVEALHPERDLSRTPLFQVMFVLQNTAIDGESLGEVQLRPLTTEGHVAKFDVMLELREVGGSLRGQLEYSTSLFKAATIERMLGHWLRLLEQIVSGSELAVTEWDMLTEREHVQMVTQWNATTVQFPRQGLAQQLFEEQVRSTPDAIAVMDDEQQISYQELNRRANQLAHALRTRGARPEVCVGVCMERSPELLIAFLGILKAGGTYVPLDPAYPEERLAYIVADCQIQLVLTNAGWPFSSAPERVQLFSWLEEWPLLAQMSSHDMRNALVPANLAYVIYTSGSTGNPKGAMVTHQGMLNHLWCKVNDLRLTSTDHVAQTASTNFDISVWQFLSALISGGRVHIISDHIAHDPLALFTYIAREQVTILEVVPSLLRASLDELERSADTPLLSLRWLLVTGEVFPTEPGARWLALYASIPLLNAYGPTECSDDVTHEVLSVMPTRETWSVPIGRALANTRLYVLDAHALPVPVGVPGELYVGGLGVGRGYMRNAQQTAGSFVPDPFATSPGERLYRTGDLVRYLEDGRIEYLDRVDYQVKLRGYRIELGEIEAVLARQEAVRSCVVLVREDQPGNQQLVTYVVAQSTTAPSAATLLAALRGSLPEYMVPSLIVFLDDLPLTLNGKIDRRALPVPDPSQRAPGMALAVPQTPVQELLAQIWGQVLRVGQIGLHDNFFSLGGHSLLATQVHSRLRAIFGGDLPLRVLFEAPTLALLAERVERQLLDNEIGDIVPPLVPRERGQELVSLSFAQQRLWFLDQFDPGSATYNMTQGLRIKGELDRVALEASLRALVRRHESLRTHFSEAEGQPVQIIAPKEDLALLRVDLQTAERDRREAEVRRLMRQEGMRAFDLRHGPLFRAILVLLDQQDHVLILSLHHIVSDGWSNDILIREISALYEAARVGKPSPLAPLPIQYADYALWQRSWLQGAVLEQQVDYWRRHLAGVVPLELPTDFPRPAVQSSRGARLPVRLGEATSQRLRELSQREGVTLFMALLASFQVLLSRYSGQEEVAVGTPVANRSRPEVEGLIGFFVNTLVLRTDLSGRPNFREVLRRVREVCLGAYGHQDVPFEQVVEALHPQRDLSRSPLFQVMLTLQNMVSEDVELSQLDAYPFGVEGQVAKFELSLDLQETTSGLRGQIEYNTDLFSADTIKRLAEHWQLLVEAALAEPERPVNELVYLSEAERHRLLVGWNTPALVQPSNTCIHQLIERQADLLPDAIAVVYRDQWLSYRALNEQANRVARYLLSMGVKPGALIGICQERSLELLVCLLGVLKVGGAYVPLDPTLPPERLRFILYDAHIEVLLTHSSLQEHFSDFERTLVYIDRSWPVIEQQNHDNVPQRYTPDAAAYVIYTSGSTGNPKGVVVAHRSLVNAYYAWQAAYQLLEGMAHLQVASFSFDVFSGDVVRTLCSGGRLVLCPHEIRLEPEQLYGLLRSEYIQCVEFVPALLRPLADYVLSIGERCTELRLLVVGSDSWTREDYQRFQALCGPATKLINSYGLTETTIDSTYFVGASELPLVEQSIPIGRSFAGSSVYVLDTTLQPVPINVSGELYIGGEGVARGYLKRFELTAERFLPDPWRLRPGARMYKTGDRARFLSDGNLVYLGRGDGQVKLRGYRIELGEIEAVLSEQPGVQASVVLLREDQPGQQHLVAYVVTQPDRELHVDDIRQGLRTRLPEYMLPTVFVSLDALPLTPNGKVDRRSLPAPEPASSRVGQETMRAWTPVQELLAQIWGQVLGIGRVGLQENFFELGGHSLLATRVHSRVRATFGGELPLRALFEAPTLSLLAERVEAQMRAVGQEQAIPALVARPQGQLRAPLSFAQQRLWFLNQLEPGSAAYHLPLALHLEGELDVVALETAIRSLVQRHESLRTRFVEEEGQPVQVIESADIFAPRYVDLGDLEQVTGEAVLHELAQQEGRAPFDLSRGPLLRATLVLLGANTFGLLLTLHHIISDGWSNDILIREISAFYEAARAGEPSPLAPLPLQYADYALWQRSWLQGAVLERQLDYWRGHLTGLVPLDLPTDFPRPAVQTSRGARLPVRLGEATSQRLRELSQREGVTLFMALLASFQVLLSRYSGQEEIAVGTPIANRSRPEVEGLIGFFVNTLVLRTDLSGRPNFREVLRRVREVCLGAYGHQDVPFEQVVEALHLQRDLSRSPLFQVMLTLQNTTVAEGDLGELALRPVGLENQVARFDLALDLLERRGEIVGQIEYNTDLFAPETVQRLLDHWLRLIEVALAEPECAVSELDYLSQAERHQQLVAWNATTRAYPHERSLYELLEEQVQRTPDAIAATFADEHLSYWQLNSRANRLAHALRSLRVGPDVLVGLCVERGFDMLIGVLGILKAGGAYVPLDPSYPAERLAYMLADAQVPVLVTQRHLLAGLAQLDIMALCLDADEEMLRGQSALDLHTYVLPEHMAYVIYTSGSTGRPKGVPISQRALVNFLSSMRHEPGICPDDALLAVTTLSFDIAGLELYLPLLSGARVVIVSREVAIDGLALAEALERNGITIMQATPSTWRLLLASGWQGKSNLKMLCGGEGLPLDLARQLLPIADELWNMYGPTETTIWSTIQKIERDTRLITIGRPIANTSIFLLDQHLQPVPVGVPATLYIGGEGLARGYLKRPEVTAERFVVDAISGEEGVRLYNTGDLARYRADGSIELLGRADHQVKLRGYRIELGEIEAVLSGQPGVQASVVLLREDQPGHPQLVAYMVAQPDREIHVENVRQALRTRLPEYMLPTAFVLLDALPLTPNGKVDRRSLPAPEPASSRVGQETTHAWTPVQELLAQIWGQVLGIERVGLQENFFELGGHSLLATRVHSRVRATFGGELPLRALFEAPTLGLLAERVEEQLRAVGQEQTVPALVARPQGQQRAPLSFAQQRLWFLEQLDPGSTTYLLPLALRLEGDLSADALAQSLTSLVQRHESLRTRFVEEEGQPVQVIGSGEEVLLRQVDLSSLEFEERERTARNLVQQEEATPFDLGQGPLLRATLLLLGANTFGLLLTLHHIISDGWSNDILIREISAFYEAARAGEPSPLAPLPLQYADYALWQRSWLQGAVLERQLDYWRGHLDGLVPLNLPTDFARPAVQTSRGARLPVRLGEATSQRLRELSQREGVTLFMALLASLQVLLSRYSGQEEIAVGTPIANRSRPEVEGLIGFFINTLVLRTDLSGHPSFREVLLRVREVCLGAYGHQDVPFEQVVEALHLQRDLSRSPLFQVMLTLQNATLVEGSELGTVHVKSMGGESQVAKFDLTLDLIEYGGEIGGQIEYNTDLFTQETVQRLLDHWLRLIEVTLTEPERAVSELDYLSEAERYQQLVVWNATTRTYPHERGLHELLEEQVQRTPDAIAATFADEHLSYQQLNRLANRLAHALRSLRVGPDVLVGLCVERGFDMLIGVLGILKAGGAYVPLDPAYPAERLAYMFADAGMPVVVTQQHLLAQLSMPGVTTLCLDADEEMLRGQSASNPYCQVLPEHVAYVIYTSGSTGLPKGVQIPQRALVNLLWTIREQPGICPDDALLAVTTLSFDIASLEMCLPLMTGARVVIASREVAVDGLALADALERNGITIMQATPSTWRLLLAAGWQGKPDLKLFCGGEGLPVELARQLLSRASELWNMYGPTETTIYSTIQKIEMEMDPITVGRPVANTAAFILDPHLQPVPVGVPGLLYLGGQGLARGYLKRPEVTAERFVVDAISGEEGARLYNTGDLARYRADGSIELLGREDHQVKLRGYRIELGEIEAALSGQPGVQASVVLLREDQPGYQQLVAYVVAQPGTQIKVGDLRQQMRPLLPEYMLPSAFMLLDALPQTPNGKIDRRALPLPEQREGHLERDFVAAQTPVQELLASLWQRVLGLEKVGIYDDFFALGGHSMLAAQLMSHIQQAFARKLPLASLFQQSTLREQAELLAQPEALASSTLLVGMRSSSARTPLFCIHPKGGHVFSYADLVRSLDIDLPIYGIQSSGSESDEEEVHTRVEDMATMYIAAMRSVQAEGPYQLCGYSLGGLIAFEMACQLQEQGQRVSFLALVDCAVENEDVEEVGNPDERVFLVKEFSRYFPITMDDLRDLNAEEQLLFLVKQAQQDDALSQMTETDLAHMRRYVRLARAHVQALVDYRPGTYRGDVVYFASSEGEEEMPDPISEWGAHVVGNVELYIVPGRHLTMMKPPHVYTLARYVQAYLNKV